jgi:hypothetical protein
MPMSQELLRLEGGIASVLTACPSQSHNRDAGERSGTLPSTSVKSLT